MFKKTFSQEKIKQTLQNTEVHVDLAKQAKADFIANIRHDLRTPLAGMIGLLDSLHAQLTDTAQQAMVANIRTASEQFLARIHQITAFIAGEEALPRVVSEPFSPRILIKEIQTLFYSLAQQKRLTLKVEGLKTLPAQLQGDAFRCREILRHLLSNAIQFTPQGTVTVEVRCYSGTIGQVLLEWRVSDTGVGISRDQFAAIFEPFTRLQPSYQQSTVGVGLGLSLVKQYIDDLSGTLTLNSTPGQGSCFTCTLPCEPFETSPFAGSSSCLILLVEDDKMVSLAVRTLFQTLQCSIDHTQTAAQAYEKIYTDRYALILMDIGLPDGSGLDIARAVRQLPDPQRAHTPIVALSAHLDDDLRQQCLQAGMQSVLTKPLTLAQAEQLQRTYLSFSASSLDEEK